MTTITSRASGDAKRYHRAFRETCYLRDTDTDIDIVIDIDIDNNNDNDDNYEIMTMMTVMFAKNDCKDL